MNNCFFCLSLIVSFGVFSCSKNFSFHSNSDISSFCNDNSSVIAIWEMESKAQDGFVYEDHLYSFTSRGYCSVFDIVENSFVTRIEVPSYNGLVPHCNSVSIIKTNANANPLVWCNVYNTYYEKKETHCMCLIYELIINNDLYELSFWKSLTIDFYDDEEIWYDSIRGYVPYGNFIIDDENIWIVTSMTGMEKTKFFKINLDTFLTRSNNGFEVVLSKEDITYIEEIDYFSNLQGCTEHNGRVYLLSGLGTETSFPLLTIVDKTSFDFRSIELKELFGLCEPEMIDFYFDSLLIGDFDGRVYVLSGIDSLFSVEHNNV